MRILFVSPAAELGGAERCLLDFISALRETAPELELGLVSFADGPLLSKVRALGVAPQVLEPPSSLSEFGESGSVGNGLDTLFRMMSAAPEGVRFLGRLRSAILRARPDVVHTNGMKAHLLAGLLSPSPARLVVHLHDFISARRASSRLLPILWKARRRAVFVANSRAVAEDFARLAPAADVRTIYNVVDTDYFSPGPAEPAWLAGCANLQPPAEQVTTFGLVATYASWKGHALFIQAAGLLHAAHPDAPLRFYVVGGPIYKTLGSQVHASDLLERARVARIDSCFGLVPFQDDIPRVYRSLNVVVHASTQPEPFGRTIIEGMACARAVLVARAGGASELYQEGENALGYEPGNAAALARTMALALDADTRERLGRSARAHAVANFGRSRLGSELLRAYAADTARASER